MAMAPTFLKKQENGGRARYTDHKKRWSPTLSGALKEGSTPGIPREPSKSHPRRRFGLWMSLSAGQPLGYEARSRFWTSRFWTQASEVSPRWGFETCHLRSPLPLNEPTMNESLSAYTGHLTMLFLFTLPFQLQSGESVPKESNN